MADCTCGGAWLVSPEWTQADIDAWIDAQNTGGVVYLAPHLTPPRPTHLEDCDG